MDDTMYPSGQSQRPDSLVERLGDESYGDLLLKILRRQMPPDENPVALLREAHLAGSPIAGFFLGEAFIYGLYGLTPDFGNARQYLQASYARGVNESGYYLFRIAHWDHRYDDALDLLERLAQNNYPPAFMMLGIYYIKGHGVVVDKKRSLDYFKRGSKLGHLHSEHWVSQLLMSSGFFSLSFFVGLARRIMLIPSFLFHHQYYPNGHRFFS